MSKHSKSYNNNFSTNFSSDITEKDTTLMTDTSSIEPETSVSTPDPAPVAEPKQIITPTASSGQINTTVKSMSIATPPVDAVIQQFNNLKQSFIDSNGPEPRSQKDRERTSFALLRLVQFILSKDKRTVYDEFYKFIKDKRKELLNPQTVFSGGNNKMKRSEIGMLTLVIAAFNRVQDNDGVDFKELERSLPGHPIFITYLSEKSARKKKD
jgi:hypothetical protein